MRRFLSNKVTILVLVFAVIALATSVTWAGNSSSPDASPSTQLSSSVVEIVPIPRPAVPEGGKLQVAGAGFAPNEVVLFQLIIGGGGPNVTLQGGFANDSGAFLADTTRATASGGLPAIVTPGIYTVIARTVAGHVASTPLIVCAAEDAIGGKCPLE